jgi:hypothetical protein
MSEKKPAKKKSAKKEAASRKKIHRKKELPKRKKLTRSERPSTGESAKIHQGVGLETGDAEASTNGVTQNDLAPEYGGES